MNMAMRKGISSTSTDQFLPFSGLSPEIYTQNLKIYTSEKENFFKKNLISKDDP